MTGKGASLGVASQQGLPGRYQGVRFQEIETVVSVVSSSGVSHELIEEAQLCLGLHSV